MAKFECTVTGDFDDLLKRISEGIEQSSYTASLEDESNFVCGDARCNVKVFERYSYSGQNRLSLTVTLFQPQPFSPIYVSAITSGGSQAMFFKINTFGEENFLQLFKDILGK